MSINIYQVTSECHQQRSCISDMKVHGSPEVSVYLCFSETDIQTSFHLECSLRFSSLFCQMFYNLLIQSYQITVSCFLLLLKLSPKIKFTFHNEIKLSQKKSYLGIVLHSDLHCQKNKERLGHIKSDFQELRSSVHLCTVMCLASSVAIKHSKRVHNNVFTNHKYHETGHVFRTSFALNTLILGDKCHTFQRKITD